MRGRPTPPATLALDEKSTSNYLREADRRSIIEHIFFLIVVVVANYWRFDNAKKSHMPYVRTYVHTPGRVLIFFFRYVVPGMICTWYVRTCEKGQHGTAAAPQKQ